MLKLGWNYKKNPTWEAENISPFELLEATVRFLPVPELA